MEQMQKMYYSCINSSASVVYEGFINKCDKQQSKKQTKSRRENLALRFGLKCAADTLKCANNGVDFVCNFLLLLEDAGLLDHREYIVKSLF